MNLDPTAIANGKRERDDDVDSSLGFGEHRAKRTLALRQSPQFLRHHRSDVSGRNAASRSPSTADITPTGSDTEDVPRDYEPKSAFSPWSSSPAMPCMQGSQRSPCRGSVPQISDAPFDVDDMEMTDPSLLPQSSYSYAPSSNNSAGRIPTPINAQFSHSRANVLSLDHDMSQCGHGATRDRRLPSPISEDDASPRFMLEGISGIQMDEDARDEKPLLKKGHARSKHSLREWTGYPHEPGGLKRFSMGYKSDCEKCRLKIPGHFSHVITYRNDND
ncbi:MAG: hypothetical protein M1818_002264 [Claussenomyces sp. TS43310]|nr:MAG: hypothetical protein M1818_002264 [Claussenomyces sp. TS43310]